MGRKGIKWEKRESIQKPKFSDFAPLSLKFKWIGFMIFFIMIISLFYQDAAEDKDE